MLLGEQWRSHAGIMIRRSRLHCHVGPTKRVHLANQVSRAVEDTRCPAHGSTALAGCYDSGDGARAPM